MEQSHNQPTQIHSAKGDQMHTETASLNKKRKFPADQLDLRFTKHKTLPSSYLESDSLKNVKRKIEAESSRRLSSGVSQSESTTGRNSFSGGDDTTMSISGQARNDIWLSVARVSDQPSTSSVNSTGSTKSLFSLMSKSMAESTSSSDEIESSYNIDFRQDNTEACAENSDKDLIYSNGIIPNNYALSCGRWSGNHDGEQGAKKLTIDKEFEQYFSSLML